MAVFVTGGAGYIGSHTCVQLLNAGYEVVIADNFVNSKPEALNRIRLNTGKEFRFYEADVTSEEAIDEIFSKEKIDSAIHFAGLKAVGESVQQPLRYYDNNLRSTLALLKMMKKHGIHNFVFSSSATVYGTPETVPIREDAPTLACTSPYGWTKLMTEHILADTCKADPELNVALLRYFNPIGAHASGTMGEDPQGIPNNLMPYITQVAIGRLEKLHVFGNDYPTPDGTCVRDYIHVMDLADGHVAALRKLETNCGLFVCNLGTGHGYSVLDMVNAFEKANDIKIPYEIAPRRAGDVPQCYADPSKAEKELGWKATRTLEDMCRDSWNWQKNNPHGYNV